MADTRPYCELPLEADGSIAFDKLPLLPPDCRIPNTLKSVRIPLAIEDEAPVETPVRKAKAKVEKVGAEMANEASYSEPAVEAKTVATVGVRPKEVVPKKAVAAEGMSPVTVAVASVAGGGVALKMLQSFLKGRLKMQDKGESSEEEKKEDNHQQCAVARHALEARIARMEQRLGGSEDDTDFSFRSLPDIEDMQKRLKQLEKTVKPLVKKPSKPLPKKPVHKRSSRK